jgi:hypothetical protein
MMAMLSALMVLAIPAIQAASCDNACSGHGTCGQNGVCQCFDNWGVGMSHDSGDCSERICPFEFAWVDTPDKLGNHHKYAECANRGICDRETGECECFPGYEGKGCARTTCPNDCSGHGRCMEIQDMPFQITPHQYETGDFLSQKAHTFASSYHKWDAEKTRGCVCDPEYGDADCSKRMCMFGNDIMDQRNDLTDTRLFQTQFIQMVVNTDDSSTSETATFTNDNTFALTFTSKLNETFTTIPIVFDFSTGGFNDMLKDVEYALESLPNKVIDDVHVAGQMARALTGSESWADHATDVNTQSGSNTDENTVYFNITFTGENVQGPQNLLTVKTTRCQDGCTPKLTGMELQVTSSSAAYTAQQVIELTQADYNSYECGRRGKCDYTTGICECFSGYTGLACGKKTNLF